MAYHVIYLTHGDDVYGHTSFDASNDEAAKEHARQFLRSPFGKGYEIWQGERLIWQSYSKIGDCP